MNVSAGPTRISIYDDKGFVELIDIMPRLVPDGRFADIAVVQSARISYGDVLKSINADNGLIKYLWTHKHTTPFESVSFQIRARMPIFVARQVMRHRLFSYNEVSYRYQQPKDEFYYPEVRLQDDTNRQMSKNGELTEEEHSQINSGQNHMNTAIEEHIPGCWNEYLNMVNDDGVAREVARTILPQSLMTEMLIKGNARTWLHFLKLRLEVGAQKEIRDLAEAIVKVIEPRIPTTFATFMDCDVHNIDIPGSWVSCISNSNKCGCFDDNGNLSNPHLLWSIMRDNGITGKRKIMEYIDTIKKLSILRAPISPEHMGIILSNPS